MWRKKNQKRKESVKKIKNIWINKREMMIRLFHNQKRKRQEKTCVRVSFLIKLQAVVYEVLEIFKNAFSKEHLQWLLLFLLWNKLIAISPLFYWNTFFLNWFFSFIFFSRTPPGDCYLVSFSKTHAYKNLIFYSLK